MGCTGGKLEDPNIDVNQEKKANKEIDNKLKKQKKDMKNEIKLLLLGMSYFDFLCCLLDVVERLRFSFVIANIVLVLYYLLKYSLCYHIYRYG